MKTLLANEFTTLETTALLELGDEISKEFPTSFLGAWELQPCDPDKEYDLRLTVCFGAITVQYLKRPGKFKLRMETHDQGRKIFTMLSVQDVLTLIGAYIIENENQLINN